MMTPVLLPKGALPGAAVGLLAAAVFAVGTAAVGVSQSIALVAPHLPRHAAVLFSLMTATVAGAGFGILVWKQRFGAGEMLLWGMAYGILEWLLVPLTLLPLLTGERFAWSI